jgi:putative transposase
MRYRRAEAPGTTYFFTVNLADRQRRLLVEHVDMLREVMRGVRQRHPFVIEAIVILPDHLHALWTLPKDDADFATRWSLIKAGFSRRLPPGERINPSRAAKRERGIWQRRYWEHLIRNDEDFARHVDYIHWNPCKHGHANSPVDWPYSSFHRFVAAGILPADWGAEGNTALDFGERAEA